MINAKDNTISYDPITGSYQEEQATVTSKSLHTQSASSNPFDIDRILYNTSSTGTDDHIDDVEALVDLPRLSTSTSSASNSPALYATSYSAPSINPNYIPTYDTYTDSQVLASIQHAINSINANEEHNVPTTTFMTPSNTTLINNTLLANIQDTLNRLNANIITNNSNLQTEAQTSTLSGAATYTVSTLSNNSVQTDHSLNTSISTQTSSQTSQTLLQIKQTLEQQLELLAYSINDLPALEEIYYMLYDQNPNSNATNKAYTLWQDIKAYTLPLQDCLSYTTLQYIDHHYYKNLLQTFKQYGFILLQAKPQNNTANTVQWSDCVKYIYKTTKSTSIITYLQYMHEQKKLEDTFHNTVQQYYKYLQLNNNH